MTKVLYLAPPRERPDHLTIASFVDEEMLALAEHGIESHLLMPAGVS